MVKGAKKVTKEEIAELKQAFGAASDQLDQARDGLGDEAMEQVEGRRGVTEDN